MNEALRKHDSRRDEKGAPATHLELVSQSYELIEVISLVAVNVDLWVEQETKSKTRSVAKKRKRRRVVQTHPDVSSNHISESFPVEIHGERLGARER